MMLGLKRGDRGREVLMLQRLLIYAECLALKGPCTTFFGPLTEKALKSFQRIHGCAVSGFVDQATFVELMYLSESFENHRPLPPGFTRPGSAASPVLLSLGAEDIIPGIKAKNMDVAILQVKLEELRLKGVHKSHTSIDGIFGPQTKRGLEHVQQSLGIYSHGNLDALTEVAIDSKLRGFGYNWQSIFQPVKMVTQSSQFHCWAAGLAMLKGWDEDYNNDRRPGQTHHHRAISHMRQHWPERIVSSDDIRNDPKRLTNENIDGIKQWTGYEVTGEGFELDFFIGVHALFKNSHREANDMPVIGPKLASLFQINYLGLGKNLPFHAFYKAMRNHDSPLLINFLLDRERFLQMKIQNSHFMIIAGMIDSDGTGKDGVLLIYNPAPSNGNYGFDANNNLQGKGSIYYAKFSEFMKTHIPYGVFVR